ncbi:hypothetical protein L209DRAFT_758452 [Thermothelomyces heterothallicus CBS 203.75]
MTPPSTSPIPILGQWILDTRSWYPGVEKVNQLETHASRAFSLLSHATRSQVLRYVRPPDAKMALASALLKHYAVAKLSRARIPWSRVVATGFTAAPGGGTKPVFVDPATGTQPVFFNVSHQAGIVAIVAVAAGGAGEEGKGEEEEEVVQVGVDVVSPAERRARDHEYIAANGWAAFVDMHAEVLGHGEVAYLKHQVPAAADDADDDGRLRAFYALWALREAYLKLGGTGLVADWVRDLEFRRFRPPTPTPGWDSPAREEEGQVLRDIGIWLRGDKVEDVDMCLRSIGPDFMIATAVRTPGRKAARLRSALGPYEVLSLEEVLDFAEASG